MCRGIDGGGFVVWQYGRVPADDIEWVVTTWKHQCEAYQLCDDYYGGDHELFFATEKFRNVFGTLFRSLADNLCPAVVDAVSDRLFVTGWDGDDAKKATELWEATHLDRTLRESIHGAVKCGDGFVIVARSKNKAGVQFWAHGADKVVIEYDDEDDPGKIVRGAKIWTDNKDFGRITLYTLDELDQVVIEKFKTVSKITNGVPEDARKWIANGEPAIEGDWNVIPIFHFGHQADLGDMGTSILVNVIPIQNALNKSVCDMLVAGEFVAFPQRWATGLHVETDEDTGKVKNPPFTPGVDRVWTGGQDVKFGQFSPSDMSGYLPIQDAFRKEMARVSGVPTHMLYLDDTWPTGEAMKTSEGRLIRLIERDHACFDGTVQAMMRFGMKLTGGKKDADVKPVWANASPHNPLLDAETQMVKQQVGISTKQSLRELGYDDAKIEEMMKENEEDALKQARLDAAATKKNGPGGQPTAFNRNGPPGQVSKPAPADQQAVQKKPIAVPQPRQGSANQGWSGS